MVAQMMESTTKLALKAVKIELMLNLFKLHNEDLLKRATIETESGYIEGGPADLLRTYGLSTCPGVGASGASGEIDKVNPSTSWEGVCFAILIKLTDLDRLFRTLRVALKFLI